MTATREAASFTEILACVAVVSVSFKLSGARIQERETHKGIVLKGAKRVVAGRRGAGRERKGNGVFGSPPLPRLILIFAPFRLARLFSRLAQKNGNDCCTCYQNLGKRCGIGKENDIRDRCDRRLGCGIVVKS